MVKECCCSTLKKAIDYETHIQFDEYGILKMYDYDIDKSYGPTFNYCPFCGAKL